MIGDQAVDVEVTLEEEHNRLVLQEQKVQITAGPGVSTERLKDFKIEPPVVDVFLYGSFKQIEGVEPSSLTVVAEVSQEQFSNKESVQITLHTMPLLPGIGVTVSPTQAVLRPKCLDKFFCCEIPGWIRGG